VTHNFLREIPQKVEGSGGLLGESYSGRFFNGYSDAEEKVEEHLPFSSYAFDLPWNGGRS
jgi:hypothetical protein